MVSLARGEAGFGASKASSTMFSSPETLQNELRLSKNNLKKKSERCGALEAALGKWIPRCIA
jgi:hypothetical protein